EIENQSEFFFLFNQKLVNVDRKVDIDVKNKRIKDILSDLFTGEDVNCLIMDRQILLSPKYITERVNVTRDRQPQEIVVTGKVTDEDGNSLPGVNIVIKGTITGTISDMDGYYSIEVDDPEAVLVFTFIGMLTQEIKVGDQTEINITLARDVIGLEEVVAVGYATKKKVNLTGSVETIRMDNIAWKPVGQTSMALQGVASGVTVTQNSGKPGGDAGLIRIRGIGTLGNSNPLILVDGIETTMNSVNLNDIESISILKDAASASIYGSRAANGVILITTKRATQKEISVTYDGYFGWQLPTDLTKKVSALEYIELKNEANANLGKAPQFTQEYIEAYQQNLGSDKYPDTDWQKVTLTGDGFTQNHSFSMIGGTDLLMLRGSFSALDQNGIIPNTGYKRYNFRLNTDINVSEKLHFRIDFDGRTENIYEPAKGVNYIFHWMQRHPAIEPAIFSNGQYGDGHNGDNSLAQSEAGGLSRTRKYNAILSLKADWSPFKDLNFSLQYSPEFYNSLYKRFQKMVPTYYYDGRLAFTVAEFNTLNQQHTRNHTNNFKGIVTFEKEMLGDHYFKAIAGYEQIEYFSEWFSAYREKFALQEYQVLDVGSLENQKSGGSATEWSLLSTFGRLNYYYKQKYLFEANIRYDGSSRFAKGNRFGWYPSFSVGWRISEEPFLKSIVFVDNLKLRASWGQLGNQEIGNYPFASVVNLTQGYILNEKPVDGACLIDLANTIISWESAEVFDLGLDLSLFQKISISADYYIKNTKDILLKLPIPMIAGLNAPYQNAGIVQNKGWDFSLIYRNRVGELEYYISAVISDVKNKIIDLKGTGPYIGTRTIRKEGYPIDAFYGYEKIGLFQTQEEVDNHATQFGGQVAAGDIKYKDQNGDGIINADYDRIIIGSRVPRYTYSLGLNVDFKGFDLIVFLQGVGKANGYLPGQAILPFNVGGSAMKTDLDRWTPENPNTSIPRITYNYTNNEVASTQYMQNAAYLRVKNVQFGYKLPQKWLNKIFLDYCRLYVSGQNLFTLDKFYDGWDVESPVSSGSFYPMVKIYSFGLNCKF
ncbi:MAG: TonB-dependent receptor, partial [Bacteroidales bacterium]|nr:TonB-dependent receptor [Bacteroidales bacterium]